MKSIEERAKEYSKGQWDIPTAIKAYIAGATEQKAIDDAERINQVLMGKGSVNVYNQGLHDTVEMAKTAFGKTCVCPSTYPSCDFWYNKLFENFIKNM